MLVDTQEMDSVMGSLTPQASLSEGFFLLYTTLQGLFIRCFYFSIMDSANGFVGGFLPLQHSQLLACSSCVSLSGFVETSLLPCWITTLLCQMGNLTWCHHHHSWTKPELRSGMGKTGPAALEASQWSSLKQLWALAGLLPCPVQQILLSSLLLKPFKIEFSKASLLTINTFLFIWNFSYSENQQENPLSSAKPWTGWGSLQGSRDSWDQGW